MEKENPYRQSIFNPPGRSGLLGRVFYFAVYRAMLRYLGPLHRPGALYRSVGILILSGMGVLLFIAGTPADFYRVYATDGYDQPSEIYAIGPDGKYMAISEFLPPGETRRVIYLEDQPDGGDPFDLKVVRSFIATEDNNFTRHPGVDPLGIARAMLVNIQAMNVKEGASTITQQVARLRFLSRDRHIIRKMREAFLALLIEMRHSKSEIMEIYLNTVPLGHGTNGIEAAARFYFDKSYRELDWGEAAVLSAMTTSPSTYSPLKKPEQSRRKVGVVLNRLVQNGDITVREAEEQFRSLTEHFYATLNRSPNDSSFQQRLNLHPYATEYVKAQLPSEFRGRVLMRGGLRIYTTINHQHQQAAEEEMIPHLRRETRRRHRSPFTRFEIFEDDLGPAVRMQELIFPMAPIRRRMTRAERDFFLEFEREFQAESELLNYLSGGTNLSKAYEYLRSTGSRIAEEEQTVEGALISLRPESGAITAVIGGSGFEPRNQLIRVEARRQAGSAFKPLVYSSAIENTGRSDSADFVLTAATLIDDSPVLYVNRDLSEYSPENYSRSYEGLIRLRRGLTLSKNAVAVRTYKNVGPDYINHTVEDLLHLSERSRGQRELPREASVALGSFDVSPLEMARAYATFASNGREVHPYVISHITDAHGRILLDNRPELERRERRQILSPGGAEIITSLLMDVVRQGTGRAAGLPGRSVAGKTGTTNRNNNAWFVGYTPELVTALYIGYDNPRSLGAGATGGGLAAPVWGRYMYKALLGEPANPFRFPGSDVVRVEICEQTGMLPGPGCGNTMVELFLPGTQPTEVNAELEGGSSNEPPPVIKRTDDVFAEDDLGF